MTEKYTIQEIAKILVEKNGLSQREANKFASDMFAVILEHLQQEGLVKVKGLGTFKIINVEARASVSVRTGERVLIDSHSKVSFIPDATMKELVNKPFSQFETVALNDGVEFDDLRDSVDEGSSKAKTFSDDAPILEVISVSDIGSEEENNPPVEVVPSEPQETVVENNQIIEEEEFADEEVTDEEEQPDHLDEDGMEDDEQAEEEEQSLLEIDDSPKAPRWLFAVLCLGAIAVALLSAFGGYQYGVASLEDIIDTVIVRDTVFIPVLEEKDSAEIDETVLQDDDVETIPQQPQTVEKVKTLPQPEAVVDDATEIADKYAKKDERVRLGAYRIVGTAQVITVQPGQTFYSLCRAYLGPDMECYMEAYNNLPPEPRLNAGQTLKIPKLERKKPQNGN